LFSAVSWADEDNAPAAMCVAINGAAVNVLSSGQIENAGTSAVTVLCPAARKLSFTKFKSRVWAVDRHSSDNVCCRVVARLPNGGQVASTPVCSTGASTSEVTLDTAEITQAYTFAAVWTECTIPAVNGTARSRLLTFRSYQN
jgi:hypothetical protein